MKRSFLACALLMLTMLGGCSRLPDCDSPKAQAIVQESILRAVARSFREKNETSAQEIAQRDMGPAPDIPPRHQAMMNRYHPEVSMFRALPRAAVRLAQRVPDEDRELDLPLILQTRQFSLLGQSLDIRLTDQVTRIGTEEDEKRGRKLCSASLHIRPRHGGGQQVTPLKVRFTLNPPPRSSRTPFYVPMSEIQADPPELGFELSDSEKTALMITGATRDMQAIPKQHDGLTLILNQAMHALLTDLEATASSHSSPRP